jgi:hypothetical protein
MKELGERFMGGTGINADAEREERGGRDDNGQGIALDGASGGDEDRTRPEKMRGNREIYHPQPCYY